MGHTSRSVEDSDAERNMDYDDLTQGVPENTRKWFTDYSYNILAKKVAVFLSLVLKIFLSLN